MNPEIPPDPRAELESRLTALLLGELSAEEAAALRQTMAQDAELAALHERLRLTIELVRETAAISAGELSKQPAPLKLSAARREALLAHFKTVAPPQLARPRARRISWLVPLAAAAAIVVLLGLLLTPKFAGRAGNKFAFQDSIRRSESIPNPNRNPTSAIAAAKADNPNPVPPSGPRLRILQERPSVASPSPASSPSGASTKVQIYTPAVTADDTPLLGDVPLTGNLFRHNPPTAPETAEAGVSGSHGKIPRLIQDRATSAAESSALTQRATKAAQDGGTLLGGTQTAYNGLTSDNKGGEHYLYDSAIQAEDVQNSGTLTNGFVNGALIAGADAGESFGNSTFAGYVPNGQIGPITLPFDPVSGGIFYTTDSVNNSNIVQASITANRSAASATNDGVYSLNAVGYINVEDTNALAALAARNGAIEFNRANLQYAEASDLSGTLQELDHSEKTQAAQSGPRASTNGVFGRSRSFVEALQPSASPPLADASAGTSAATAARGRRSGRGGGGAGGAGGGGGVFGGAGGAIGGAGGTLPLQGSNGYNALRSGASSFLSGSGSTLANPSGAFPGEGPVGQQISRDREGLDIPTEGAVANNLYDLYWGEGAADKFPQAMAVTNSIYLADNSDAPPYQVRQQAASVDTWDGNTYPAASPVSGLGARNNITAGKINQPSGTPLSSSSPKLALATPLAPATRPLSTRSQDVPLNPATPPPVPQPEIQTRDNAFSTFSLNVSDVSFKLAAASLQKGVLPDPATVRSEEFINAFDYRDIEPTPGAPIGFAWERASYPFAHNRDLLRFSVKTAAQGREAGRPINIVLLLDKSGSMERADRVAIIREALRVLAAQLQPRDTLSVVVFARTARLWADGVSGSQAGALADALEGITPEGGTNLEEAMKLAYETALRHYLANGENRVVLLTDGAANLGDVEPEDLKKKAAANRTQGIALDCFGVGWEDYNDNLLEVLSRAGGGRYGFINAPEEAATEFAGQLAGALRVAASDVKVQVEFNPGRVTSYRQIGYAKDQLTKEQFRDNTVKAAQLGVKESGNALYTVEINPQGDGPLCTVHVRYRAPGTSDYYEHAWDVPYTGVAPSLDQAGPAIRLAASVSAFSEWLAGNSYAGEVTPDQLLGYMRGVPEIYGADTRPALLAQMLREAKSISGK